VNTTTDERFWIILMTVVCLGAKYANNLGVSNFDLPALKDFMVTRLGNMRHTLTSSSVNMNNVGDVVTILNQFYTDARARHMITTNKFPAGVGKPVKNSIKTLSDISRVDGIWMHFAEDENRLRISCIRLSEWCKDNAVSRGNFIDALIKKTNARKMNGKLGAGTAISQMAESLYEIDTDKIPEIDFS
jgi:hypothetical protein